MTNISSSAEAVASEMFESLARNFPIACASDEFYYFPQAQLSAPRWRTWDRFSPENITAFVRRLSAWEDRLNSLSAALGSARDGKSFLETQTDMAMLQKLARTLREQLSEVRTWETQPTFYLMIVCIGLAEAVTSADASAKHDRAETLPAFLEQAGHNLRQVPALFRDIGLEMVPDTRKYLVTLIEQENLSELKPALIALEGFEQAIRDVSVRENFLLEPDLLERVYRSHINTGMDIHEIRRETDLEIRQMQQIMNEAARSILSGRSSKQLSGQALWSEAVRHIPMPAVGKEGLIGLYRDEVSRLANHCLDNGLVSRERFASCPVHIAPVPAFLSAIRTASSYSIPPGHPPVGGVFYIINAHSPEEARQEYHREYRILSAHETYPGHHLLDISRWSLPQPVRQVVEQPVFYEGWACFAETLMRETGYLSEPWDLLLLAKRRLWRAIRGKVDVGLQTGTMDIPTAARCLNEIGVPMSRAVSSAQKYPLNPGYQICYTIGLRRFLELFEQHGRDDLQHFVQTVLNHGETGFESLSERLEDVELGHIIREREHEKPNAKEVSLDDL